MSASRVKDEPVETGDDCPTEPHVHVTLPMRPGRTHVPLVVYVQAGQTPDGVAIDVSALVRIRTESLASDFTPEDAQAELLLRVRDALTMRIDELRKKGS